MAEAAKLEAPAPAPEEEEKPKVVVLKSSDGAEFEVEEAQARGSDTIKNLLDDGCGGTPIPLPNVSSEILTKVIEYWRRRPGGSEEERKAWERKFLKMERDTTLALLLAANYLEAKPLMDFLCGAIADHIKDMSVDEVRDYLGIENDFTPEEEARNRREHSWAFEKQ